MINLKKSHLYSLFCFTLFIPLILSQKHGSPSTKLHVTPDKSDTFQIINFDDISEKEDSQFARGKRETTEQRNITTKVFNLIDSHLQLMVNWAGEGSDVIICLARNPTPYPQEGASFEDSSPSAVFVSYNYGDTYVNRTEKFASASLDKFFNHQKFNTYTVFIDSTNKQLFTSSNDVNNVTRTKLLFTPSDVLLHPEDALTFLVYDKVDPKKKLWVTRDFGQGFTLVQEAVKSYAWSPSNNNLDEETKIKNEKKGLLLYVERMEPYGTNTILASRSFFQDDLETVARNVLDFQVKGDFIFTVKEAKNKTGDLDLWVSYKKASFVRARFDTNLPRLEYHITDVTDRRVFLSVRHTDELSNLYVSETIDNFHLSLERIFCFFPNTSYREIFSKSPDAFTDLHKVEGMNGIYIATHVVSLPESNILPEHLVTLITYDRGGEWHYLQPPTKDDSGQPIDCDKSKNCSLHLTQKFTQLYRMQNFKPILSSKSAPGLIMANGVLGKSVKGHPGLFLSTNAGLTWRHIIKSYYVFNFGDHGGVLVAVMFASTGKTRELLYSTDYGENWESWIFSTDHLHIFGLMTEPGENTTIFTLFGSIKSRHEWLIIKVDLKNAFDRACTKDDYKQWSPSAENGRRMPCVLGRKDTYVRRLETHNCYDNRSIDQPIRSETCQCEEEDFECDFGFMKDAVFKKGCILNQTILGYDPHEIPSTCVAGQTYNRTKGYRKIVGDECFGGNEDLYLPDIIPCPIKEMNAFLLVALREKIARLDLDSRNEMETLPIFNLKNIIAIEFDLQTNCVYWADIINDTIGRQCLDGKREPEILVEANLYSIEGMALDWMSNHLYFVDGMRATIQLISTDAQHEGRMRKTILNSDHLKKPRGIALHPRQGLMFWTDWAPNHACVSSAYLDGTGIKQLFKSPDVAWPNGITIDYMAERIYWADAREDYIASANLDGSNMIKIISQHSSVAHPFSVAIFKENLIWDDWKEDSIFITNKNNALAILRLIKDQEGLMDLKVYSHTVQKGTNACSNKNLCSHICVGKGGSDYVCLCPDGMEKVGSNTCLCPGKIKPFNNGTCPSVAHTCSPHQFQCASNNYSCLPITWKCDGEEDCPDGSDEAGCIQTTCPPTKFRCENNNKCIPAYWHCDIDLDCSDGSDELRCSYVCNTEQFQCSNGRCISKLWLCDHEDDCRDGSDEQNCTKNFTRTCRVGEFACVNNNQCIPSSWQCDGEQDCSDGSDENENCKINHCEDWQFKCDNNQCTFKSWVCDGDHDCRDGSDERNCTDHKDSFIPTPPHSHITNETVCPDVMFHCNNNECIPYWWKCDNVDDCGDNSDEMGCGRTDEETFTPTKPTNVTTSCGPEKFQCADGKCIPQKFVCDNITDCDDKADEKHCDHIIRCYTNQFKCNDGSCLPLQKVCDGVTDCEDGYDEALCDGGITSPPRPTCNPGMFACDTLRCFPLTFKCDGHQDCYDGTDEDNCGPNTTRVYQVLHLGVEPRSINSSNLVLYWLVPNPKGIEFEFLPSIAEQGHSWQNATSWTTGINHRFTGLHAFTSYNMTVYVRIKKTDIVSTPSKYLVAMTGEGVPSVPWNVTAKQISANKIELKWNRPLKPEGVITSYNIFMTPPIPPVSTTTRSNVDNYTFEYNFLLNVNYSFWIIALNSEHRSNTSNVVTLTPDESAVIDQVRESKANPTENGSMHLEWAPVANVTGYYIQIHLPSSYPSMSAILTNNTNTHFDFNNLAPGVEYEFEIRGLRKDYHGLPSFAKATLPGEPLPRIHDLKAVLITNEGTSVKLTWGAPRDKRKIEWKYAVYFAYRTIEFSVPYLVTSDLSATVEHLHSCESYLFTIGIAGPLGIGPLGNIKNVVTRFNILAPPKNIQISSDKQNDNIMHITWFPSCQMIVDKVSYVINVRELNLGFNSSTTLKERPFTGKYTHWYEIQHGGHYGVSISTNMPGANKSEEVIWAAPPLPVPEEVQLLPEINGSLFVYWKDIKLEINKKYSYVVVITEGSVLNASNSQEFITNTPPFIFNDVKPDMTYSVAVCLRTEDGYRSALSGAESHRIDKENWLSGITTSSLVSVAVPVILVVIALAAALGFFVIRHRRLQHNFASFANSHYDTRSGAATFGDGLEEEDSPVIRGFSDDEPLVIA